MAAPYKHVWGLPDLDGQFRRVGRSFNTSSASRLSTGEGARAVAPRVVRDLVSLGEAPVFQTGYAGFLVARSSS